MMRAIPAFALAMVGLHFCGASDFIMHKTVRRCFGVAIFMLVGGWVVGCSQSRVPDAAAADALAPQLRRGNDVTQLYVGGRPLLIRGGELGNSDASDPGVLEGALARCERMHLNTVMLPVYWDRIEPRENVFDWTLVRGAIDGARRHHLHLVFLWFGTWKNSMSCYAPTWVKRDTRRFPRAARSTGEVMEIVSPESSSAVDADATAFAALMRWTRGYDADRKTVVMVQVENEVGMIPEARDHSEVSEAAYQTPVPAELVSLAVEGKLGREVEGVWEKAGRKRAGPWGEVFGTSAEGEEIFTAWEIASDVERVAAAGRAAYPLPMYANAALMRPGYRPGQYPGGGPLPHLLEVWRAAAPSLAMISPDIYFPNFGEWCERYTRGGNPLFIPEMAPSARAPGNIVYAIGHFKAIGCGPFSIENVSAAREGQIGGCYEMLAGLGPWTLRAQQAGGIDALSPQAGFDWSIASAPQRCEVGGIIFEGTFDRPDAGGSAQSSTLPTLGVGKWDAPAGTPLGAALIVQVGPEEFLIAGSGATITFAPADGNGHVGIDSAQEGRFDAEGRWVGRRWLNGDETHQGRHVHLPEGVWTVQRVRVYRY